MCTLAAMGALGLLLPPVGRHRLRMAGSALQPHTARRLRSRRTPTATVMVVPRLVDTGDMAGTVAAEVELAHTEGTGAQRRMAMGKLRLVEGMVDTAGMEGTVKVEEEPRKEVMALRQALRKRTGEEQAGTAMVGTVGTVAVVVQLEVLLPPHTAHMAGTASNKEGRPREVGTAVILTQEEVTAALARAGKDVSRIAEHSTTQFSTAGQALISLSLSHTFLYSTPRNRSSR